MPVWLRTLAELNPLSYAIDAIRAVNTGVLPFVQIAALIALCLIVTVVSVHVFRRVTV